MTASLSSIIVDDELHGIESLSHILQAVCPEVSIVGTAQTLPAAEALMRNTPLDLAFLDVQMGTQTIFSLLQRLDRINFEIIFTSAHDHALTAIKFMAIDYLLKPIDMDALREAVTRATFNRQHRNFYEHAQELVASLQRSHTEDSKIAVPTRDGYEFVFTKDILYCAADRSYTTLHLRNNRQIIASQILKHYEELLEGFRFVRIHNSYLVNVQHIKNMSRTDGGFVLMENGEQLPISKSRRDNLLAELKIK